MKKKKPAKQESYTYMGWDVDWDGSTFGKHGNGPFASEASAKKCLANVGYPGVVVQVKITSGYLPRWAVQIAR